MQEEQLISILQDVALGTLTVIEAKEIITGLFTKEYPFGIEYVDEFGNNKYKIVKATNEATAEYIFRYNNVYHCKINKISLI